MTVFFPRKSNWLVASVAVTTLAACSTQQSGGSEWNGEPVNETDAVITLQLPGEPESIQLNGEPATTLANRGPGTVKLLIPSDETGISCENTILVQFVSGQTGTLLANHCHGDTEFTVTPGEIIDARVTKQDIDNPDEDLFPEPGTSLEFEWSANGFEQLPANFEWWGFGGKSPSFALSVPETDNFVWMADCENGQTANWVALMPSDPKLGDTGSLQLEVNGRRTREYTAMVGRLPYGDGGPDAVMTVIDLPINDPIFREMKAGEWLYMWMRLNGEETKLRVSLMGAGTALNRFLGACQ